jgi:AraC-like DNA-binding protein
MDTVTNGGPGALLPLVGDTAELHGSEKTEYWKAVFGPLWGAVNLRAVEDGQISGSLHSRRIGELTFNRIAFGNQQFERTKSGRGGDSEPFYSLSFPERGAADIAVGDASTRLLPRNAYLLNNSLTARLKVTGEYSTFNIKIPISSLEYRVGRKTDILQRAIVHPDSIYHMMHRLIAELLGNADTLDDRSVGFLTSQMLDTVAFFLLSGGALSEDSLAMRAVRARVLAYLDRRYSDPALTPDRIASACGISRSYLYKVFSGGETVMESLRNRRLKAARGMMKNNFADQSLTQIAYACGFSSSSEFSRQFKAAYGVSPSRI